MGGSERRSRRESAKAWGGVVKGKIAESISADLLDEDSMVPEGYPAMREGS